MEEFHIDKTDPLPLYVQLQRSIINKINVGEYKEDTSLPAEHVIIKDSGLSRTTVRQAIDNLEKEGYIEKRRGIGTFVSSKKKTLWNLERLRSFREEFSMKGKRNSTRLLEMGKIENNELLTKVFGEYEKEFYILERLRYIDEQPVIVVTTYVPSSLVSGLKKYDFNSQSLFNIMENDYGISIGFADKEFRAKIAEPKDAVLLTIEQGSPTQEVRTTTYDNKGEPIEFSISRDRGDLSVHKIRLNHEKQ
jgi:GntR family transcriptional regulator